MYQMIIIDTKNMQSAFILYKCKIDYVWGMADMKNKVRYMLVVCAILLTGCGKNTSDDIKQDMSALDVNVNTDTDSVDNTGKNYDIPENLNYEVAGTSGTTTMSVDAVVEADGYGNAKVYDEKPVEIDSEYLTSYAEQIFDDGSYYSIKPYRCMDEDELSEERDFWESESDRASEEYAAYTDKYIKSSKLDVIDSCFGIIGEYSDGWKQDGVIWSHALTQEDAGDNNVEAVNVKNAKLRGFIDGTAYELTYNATDDSESPILQLINPLYDNKNDIYGYSMHGQSSTLYGDNIVDSGFAKNEADDFIYKLGYEDMTLARTADIQLTDNTLDGYLLVYVRNKDGVPVIDSKSCTYVEGYDRAGYQEYIEVYVNEYGVMRARLMNMYEIEETMSDDTSLLSFDRIDENAKSYIKAYIDSGDYYYKINKVRFGYVSVCYGNSYALIPAWVYQYYEASFDEYDYEFAINAIDGSLIDMNYAEYTFYYID